MRVETMISMPRTGARVASRYEHRDQVVQRLQHHGAGAHLVGRERWTAGGRRPRWPNGPAAGSAADAARTSQTESWTASSEPNSLAVSHGTAPADARPSRSPSS